LGASQSWRLENILKVSPDPVKCVTQVMNRATDLLKTLTLFLLLYLIIYAPITHWPLESGAELFLHINIARLVRRETNNSTWGS